MLSEYGINIPGDLFGLALAGILAYLAASWGPQWGRIAWHISMAISGAASATLLPTAISRGDADIFLYHTFWVLVGVVGVLRLRVMYRRHRRTEVHRTAPEGVRRPTVVTNPAAAPRGSSEKVTVYKITSLP